jgi:HIV Tat-specific factor 1
VRKVKLYKDESGEPKGDGLVTFGSEAAAKAAMEPGRDWEIFGEPLTVSPATFHERPSVSQADWSRMVVLCHMATQEQVAASADTRGFVSGLEEEVWLECGKHGRIERVQCFPADPACAIVVRFESSASAAACVEAMNGRFFDGRSVDADVYDGHRKRALPEGVDVERSFRLGRLVEERQAAARAREEETRAAAAAAAELKAAEVAAAAAAEAVAAGEAAAREAAAAAARVALPEKTYVKVRELVSRPESNGSVGVIEGRDEATGRYAVRLRDGSVLALKLANLLQMAEVRLVGMEGELAPHEGATATVFEREDEAEMYGVELPGGQSVAVGFSNVLLPEGAHGVVAGLQSAAQYNGLAARVLEYDAASGRYLALVDGGKQLRLRRQNLRL